MRNPRTLIVTASLIIVLLLCNLLVPGHSAAVYVASFILSSALFLLLAWQVLSAEVSARTVVVLVACSILVRLSFLTTPPIGSDDVYRYIWDAKVAANGINPYEFSPEAEELSALRSDLLPAKVNHPSMKTVYFPIAQWIFLGGYGLSGEEIWGYKLELLIAEVLTILGLVMLLRGAGGSLKYVMLYALCPLSIVSFAVDAHVDGFGIPFLVFALVLTIRGNRVPAWILFGLSIAVKPVAIVLLPVLFFYEKGVARRAATILVPSVIAVAQFLPYMGGVNVFESLTVYTERWMFNGAVFNTLLMVFRDNELTRIVCAVLLACSVVLTIMSKHDLLVKAWLSIFLLLMFSPVVHPWYVAWLAVLLPAVPRWSGIALAATVSVASITVLVYGATGVWGEYPLILLAEYVPVAVLFFRELPKRPTDLPPVRSE